MNYYSKQNNSSFWLDQSSRFDVLTGEALVEGKDYHKIASTLRSISNFVNIVTGQSIKVEYNSKDQSYTDGQAVVISSNIKDNQYDATVGLALHEGSHIKLTDFNVLPELMSSNTTLIPDELVQKIKEKHFSAESDRKDMGSAKWYIIGKVKDLLNIVEDRRIDNYIYRTAPGYRGYYQAMYDKYFNASSIDKGLRSGDKRELDWDSYMFRVCNITNHNRDLNALPGLQDIWNVLDLKNIGRLKSTTDALDVAFKMFDIIDSNIPVAEGKGDENGNEETEGNDNPEECGDTTGSAPDCDNSGGEDDGSCAEGEDAQSAKSTNPPELSQREKDRLRKDIQKQKDFMSGDVKKTNMSKADINKTKAVAEAGSDMRCVGVNSRYSPKGVNCIVVKNVTQKLIDSNVYATLKQYNGSPRKQENIDRGIVLGKQLGRKLQIRNDETTLKYNRLRRGKMDKRLIASLGFGNEQVFEQIFVDRFKPVKLHISVDASGSMSGEKWDQTQTAVVAIAQAASMCRNLQVTISYRTTEHVGNRDVPAIFIAYDSSKDKMTKIRTLFQYIGSPGITPEGLCFEAIQKEIASASSSDESYFINFSDGQPYFHSNGMQYWGDVAEKHTKKQVDNMAARGIKVLSYFISCDRSSWGTYDTSKDMDRFKIMYGKSATKIDVTQLQGLSKSLNNLFTEKN
tara:strand:- start:556 stop:2604 length:2049 start_codon:yes stop_codon:yes gene_type:complete